MNNKEYQVFISSTYADLTEERKKILDVLFMADCIPARASMRPSAFPGYLPVAFWMAALPIRRRDRTGIAPVSPAGICCIRRSVISNDSVFSISEA